MREQHADQENEKRYYGKEFYKGITISPYSRLNSHVNDIIESL